MGIPAQQLETWSNPGAVVTAKAAHESIRLALTGDRRLKGKDIEIYLQGSYKNDTNIYGDSDVDVVAQLNDVFMPDITALSMNERTRWRAAFSDATYRWENFQADVISALQDYYGAGAVKPGNKAIRLVGTSSRLPADIVPALHYRKYRRFISLNDEESVEGIWFCAARDNCSVVNFPKQHYANGVAKNGAPCTQGRFKPSVRMFKNARNCLVSKRMIADGAGPSYFLQCLLYNVPDRYFTADMQSTYCGVVQYLLNTPLDTFVCQNGEVPLFGDTREQWTRDGAQEFIGALSVLWNRW